MRLGYRKTKPHHWTAAETPTAAALFKQYFIPGAYGGQVRAIKAVAAQLNLPIQKVYARFQQYGPSFDGSTLHRREMALHVAVSNEAMVQRDLRREAADRRDLTAVLCGDPPPGYSALDRRDT